MSANDVDGPAPDPGDPMTGLLRQLIGDDKDEHLLYDRLEALVDQRLSAADETLVRAHLSQCPSCHANVAHLQEIAAQMRREPSGEAVIAFKPRTRSIWTRQIYWLAAAAAGVIAAVLLSPDRADVYKSPVPPLGGVPEVRPERTEQMAPNPVLPPAESEIPVPESSHRRATAPTGDPAASSTGGAARGIPDAAFKAAPPIGPTGDKPAPSIGAAARGTPELAPPAAPPIGPPGDNTAPSTGATARGTAVQTVAVDAAKVPVPLSEEEFAKANILEVLEAFCAGYASLQPAALKAIWPKADTVALERQMKQYTSAQCQFTKLRFVSLDPAEGRATVAAELKRGVLFTGSSKQDVYEQIATLTLLRSDRRSPWRIDAVAFKPKPQ